MDLSDIPVPKDDVLMREEEGEFAILFRPEFGTIKRLNAAGTQIWKSCDGKRSVAEIVDYLSTVFENVDKNTLQADIIRFLTTLEEMDLIEPE